MLSFIKVFISKDNPQGAGVERIIVTTIECYSGENCIKFGE
jgi:hypothetical protein